MVNMLRRLFPEQAEGDLGSDIQVRCAVAIVMLLLVVMAVLAYDADGLVLTAAGAALMSCLWLITRLWKHGRSARTRSDGRERRQQAAILKLLDEMGPLADGDLSVRATVDESMTGALADAFNHAVSELRWLVGATVGYAQAVREAVARTHQPMRGLASGPSVQSREILRSSNYLGAMSGVMTELALGAGEAVHQSQASSAAVSRGRESLTNAGLEFTRIRDESSLTTRLTHRLAENLRAIDSESSAIQDLAERTDLLALNTTVRAAVVGGERGLRDTADYARLSDDVADLAAVLNRASREIGALTSAIRDDTDEILRAMASTDEALASGVSELDSLQLELEAVEASVGELDAVVQDTAESAARQARVVGRVSGNMTVIDRISRDAADGAAHVSVSLDELQALADELERSVAGFRLPVVRPVPRPGSLIGPQHESQAGRPSPDAWKSAPAERSS